MTTNVRDIIRNHQVKVPEGAIKCFEDKVQSSDPKKLALYSCTMTRILFAYIIGERVISQQSFRSIDGCTRPDMKVLNCIQDMMDSRPVFGKVDVSEEFQKFGDMLRTQQKCQSVRPTRSVTYYAGGAKKRSARCGKREKEEAKKRRAGSKTEGQQSVAHQVSRSAPSVPKDDCLIQELSEFVVLKGAASSNSSQEEHSPVGPEKRQLTDNEASVVSKALPSMPDLFSDE
ncbi:Hypothetical predicted protein [Cloeon dipterum]|uniref:Uncharacterized protein n=1 Tax=Cloeon dipterum TaxID=197152 RepID=A0A8S1DZC5_9INSE|nr:Hypothetical predicted protein [Cloeon dipterum]